MHGNRSQAIQPLLGAATIALATCLWLGCSSDDSMTGAAAANPQTQWGQACTLNLSAEPVLQSTGYQRCSEVWTKEQNGGQACLDVATCQRMGGTCTTKNGGFFGDTRCLATCNPAACPDGAGKCVTCEGQTPHCESTFDKCYPPSVPVLNGYGQACQPLPNGCSSTLDCCNHRLGFESTCYQLMTLGEPNPYSTPSCSYNCSSNADCDDIYGAANGYCCLEVLAVAPSGVSTLEYTPVGQPNGTRTCSTQEYDSRCTRVPTATSSSSGSGSSTSCDYSGCMKACTEVGGTNCGEDCKC